MLSATKNHIRDKLSFAIDKTNVCSCVESIVAFKNFDPQSMRVFLCGLDKYVNMYVVFGELVRIKMGLSGLFMCK